MLRNDLNEKMTQASLSWMRNRHPQITNVYFTKRGGVNFGRQSYLVTVLYTEDPPAISDYDFRKEVWMLVLALQRYMHCDVGDIDIRPHYKSEIPENFSRNSEIEIGV
jgi:hypothetical protein